MLGGLPLQGLACLTVTLAPVGFETWVDKRMPHRLHVPEGECGNWLRLRPPLKNDTSVTLTRSSLTLQLNNFSLGIVAAGPVIKHELFIRQLAQEQDFLVLSQLPPSAGLLIKR